MIRWTPSNTGQELKFISSESLEGTVDIRFTNETSGEVFNTSANLTAERYYSECTVSYEAQEGENLVIEVFKQTTEDLLWRSKALVTSQTGDYTLTTEEEIVDSDDFTDIIDD